jgi:hypothetical protein
MLDAHGQYQNIHLDASFAALSDATRRGILEQWCALMRISRHRRRPFQTIVDGVSGERGRRFR